MIANRAKRVVLFYIADIITHPQMSAHGKSKVCPKRVQHKYTNGVLNWRKRHTITFRSVDYGKKLSDLITCEFAADAQSANGYPKWYSKSTFGIPDSAFETNERDVHRGEYHQGQNKFACASLTNGSQVVDTATSRTITTVQKISVCVRLHAFANISCTHSCAPKP